MLVILYVALVLLVLSEIRSIVIITLRFRTRPRARPITAAPEPLPRVTVQLPIYRERLVVRRLLDSVLDLDYPRHRLTIQVLDDSEEAEAALIEAIVRQYENDAVRVNYLHRSERIGYKAGNLNYGLRRVTDDFVAVFDADCRPARDFLRRTMPYFSDERTVGVQARWSYLNDLDSPLNAMQAAALDTLFSFENDTRARMGVSGIFLGAGGVWRKNAIEELGGWRETPFTAEDIDLSYRARLRGWFVAYEGRSLLKCELPGTYLAYKGQQRRWARSCFRVLVDHWGPMLRGGRFGLLEGSMLFRLVGLQTLNIIVPIISVYPAVGLPRTRAWMASQLGLTAILTFSPTLLQLVLSQKLLYPDWGRRARLLLRAAPMMIGLSVTLFAGFCDTLFAPEREWFKTLREGEQGVIRGSRRRWLRAALPISAAELGLGLIALTGFAFAIRNGYWESWVVLLSMALAYLCSAWAGVSEVRARLSAGA